MRCVVFGDPGLHLALEVRNCRKLCVYSHKVAPGVDVGNPAQDSEMTSANRIKRKWHHQTMMSRERNVIKL